jgi:hypothetical protein
MKAHTGQSAPTQPTPRASAPPGGLGAGRVGKHLPTSLLTKLVLHLGAGDLATSARRRCGGTCLRHPLARRCARWLRSRLAPALGLLLRESHPVGSEVLALRYCAVTRSHEDNARSFTGVTAAVTIIGGTSSKALLAMASKSHAHTAAGTHSRIHSRHSRALICSLSPWPCYCTVNITPQRVEGQM